VTTTSANGLSTTVQLDPTGNGAYTATDARATSADGSMTEVLTRLAANQTLRQRNVLTTSADGRSQSLQRDTDGDNIADHFETTSIGSNGSTVDTIWDTTAAGALRDRAVTTTDADGLSRSIVMDSDGDGAIDFI
jgi:hypothetical protein